VFIVHPKFGAKLIIFLQKFSLKVAFLTKYALESIVYQLKSLTLQQFISNNRDFKVFQSP